MAEGDAESFATKLRILRDRAGLTQEELAERAGVTPHAISTLERGTRTRPYPHTVRSIADALNVSDLERRGLIASVPRRNTAVVSGAQAGSPAATPTDRARSRSRLVVPPTRLYGRDDDIAKITRLARSADTRLITLTGPGGVGKTRLAAAVSEELSDDYPDGSVQIALSALADAREVTASIGRALDVAGCDRPDAVHLIAAQLGRLRVLLVLDNFEHLLSAAADVGRLISTCPNLTVLVTSRSPLRIRAEREFSVAPLSLPVGDVTSLDALAASASGALVLDRVLGISPPPPMTADDVRALGRLCRRLAGLPLAIELAIAHLRLLTPQSLLERLDQISTAGPRDLPERQRTMKATLDWSYGLLSTEQRTLFRMLSVFRGGVTLTATEEVAVASATFAAGDVLDLLEKLVEHSLVVVSPNADASRRYDMLEPVAQYARGLLVGEEFAEVGRAHARVYLALAEQAAVGYQGADQVRWLNLIQAEEANVLVAIDRSLDSGDGEIAGRITWAMWLYWWLRSQPSVGRRRAIRCLTVELPPPVLARVHLTAATMSYAGGDLPASAGHWEEAFRLGTEQDDAEIACAGRAGTGLAALGTGDLERAHRFFTEALPLGVSAGVSGEWLRSLIHVWLGTILLLQDNPAAAVVEIERGLSLARNRGDRLATYVALFNLSQAATALGDHPRARIYLTEGIALSQQTQDLANLAYFLDALAVVESAENAHDRVAVLLGAAHALRETVGATVYGYYLPDEALRVRAEQQARASLGEDAYDDAVDSGRGLDPIDIVRFALQTHHTEKRLETQLAGGNAALSADQVNRRPAPRWPPPDLPGSHGSPG